MLTVSNYHYIREDFKTPFPSIFGVTPKAFMEQLVACKAIGDFIHPQDLVKDADHILKSEKNYLLVTFDDGLREQFEMAKPILDSLKIPALFFVNSINFIEKKVTLVHKIHLLRSQIAPGELIRSFSEINSEMNTQLTVEEKKKAETHYNFDDLESAHLKFILNFKLSRAEQSSLIDGLFDSYFDEEKVNRELYMTETQLKALADEEMLGSHAHSHLPLGYLKPDEIKNELLKPKQYLESLTGKKINCVSYPYGSREACTPIVSSIASDIRYGVGFTMERGINTGGEDKLRLKRFDCNDLPMGKNEKAFKDAYSLIYK